MVAVLAYRRWSFTKGSSSQALTGSHIEVRLCLFFFTSTLNRNVLHSRNLHTKLWMFGELFGQGCPQLHPHRVNVKLTKTISSLSGVPWGTGAIVRSNRIYTLFISSTSVVFLRTFVAICWLADITVSRLMTNTLPVKISKRKVETDLFNDTDM